MGGISYLVDDLVCFYLYLGMGFFVSELKVVEYDEVDDSRLLVICIIFMGLYGVDLLFLMVYFDDIVQYREGYEVLQGLLDIFSYWIMMQFYCIWWKYFWFVIFEFGGIDCFLQLLLGLVGLGIFGMMQYIVLLVLCFLVLIGVLCQLGKIQQGIQVLVILLVLEIIVRVSLYSLCLVVISQLLGFYGDDDFFLDGNMLLGDEVMDVSSQFFVVFIIDNFVEVQGWKFDGLLFWDFFILLWVYFGW